MEDPRPGSGILHMAGLIVSPIKGLSCIYDHPDEGFRFAPHSRYDLSPSGLKLPPPLTPHLFSLLIQIAAKKFLDSFLTLHMSGFEFNFHTHPWKQRIDK